MVVKVGVIQVLHEEVDILRHIWYTSMANRRWINNVGRAVEGSGLHSVTDSNVREGIASRYSSSRKVVGKRLGGNGKLMLYEVSWPFERTMLWSALGMERWSTCGRWKPVENRQDNRPDLTRFTCKTKGWENRTPGGLRETKSARIDDVVGPY